MNDLSEFYRQHWDAGAYGDEASDAFQVEIFRKMFPGYEEFVAKHFVGNDRILDAGCGDGTAARAFFGDHLPRADYHGIDESGFDAAATEFNRRGMIGRNISLYKINIYDAPYRFKDTLFDWVFCVGVLHYQQDIPAALKCLNAVLVPGGYMALWVYKEQPPIRKLTDAYLRSKCAGLSPSTTKELLAPITDIGIQLGEIDGIITCGDIPWLGVKAGTYTVQRFFYYYIMKLFFHPDLSFRRHLVNNWNAFYPQNVTFLSEGEVGKLLADNNLEVVLWNMDGNGHAIIARKT